MEYAHRGSLSQVLQQAAASPEAAGALSWSLRLRIVSLQPFFSMNSQQKYLATSCWAALFQARAVAQGEVLWLPVHVIICHGCSEPGWVMRH